MFVSFLRSLLVGAALMGVSAMSIASEKADIIDTAKSAGSFNTLVAAIEAAGLADTLRGKGPFTVFAPTDAAFAKLPPGTVESLLKDKEKLAKILTYHVVPGQLMAKDVKPGKVTTVQGSKLNITKGSAGVKVDSANVLSTDVLATNGVIHVIDTVILPN
ncbi:MAG TPA: fasciclin domain-containing protein [Burkholderiales bacterium]|nr:fasciclin domain-containing protein [Burkholderiales bacterium]